MVKTFVDEKALALILPFRNRYDPDTNVLSSQNLPQSQPAFYTVYQIRTNKLIRIPGYLNINYGVHYIVKIP